MATPYFVQDRRERDTVDYVEPQGIEVVEHETLEARIAFWLQWESVGGWAMVNEVPR